MSDTMSADHYKKYDKIAQEVGIRPLKKIIPVSQAKIRRALDSGDTHLNTILLMAWERAAGRLDCSSVANIRADFQMSFKFPWTGKKVNGLSLVERVCTLKHVAKHYYI